MSRGIVWSLEEGGVQFRRLVRPSVVQSPVAAFRRLSLALAVSESSGGLVFSDPTGGIRAVDLPPDARQALLMVFDVCRR